MELADLGDRWEQDQLREEANHHSGCFECLRLSILRKEFLK